MTSSTTSNTPEVTPAIAPAVKSAPAQNARILLKELQEKFPAFGEYMPLAIGIDKQLIARCPELNRKVLRMALGMHVNSLRYLKGMEKATVRFDLDGKTTDEVTDVHRTHASETLRERFKKNAEHRKLQRVAEEAARLAEEEARQRTEKLNQLTAKFSRKG
ncbi:ProQ/FINO family protein [Glaciimonas sp. PCH181]|uniref:ProQ/FINO family protein n=1 Tax=Glaciimonas sp. PCH181 TaxID=2133943 RepID=UPI000D33DAC7|nr:ProQ/FINO family protein [Glaciimonas sp. PCH181]PUA16871.1 osmoprotectant transporter activator [Glaciimonas sp. PCH181]